MAFYYDEWKRTMEDEKARHELYSRTKIQWVEDHPDATHKEYEAAIEKIAIECGL